MSAAMESDSFSLTDAYALLDAQSHEEADSLISSLLADNPAGRGELQFRCLLLFFMGREMEAWTFYRRARTIDPDCASFYNNLSTAFTRLTNYPRAVEMAGKALKLNCNKLYIQNAVKVYNSAGIESAEHGDYPKAASLFSSSLKIDPANAHTLHCFSCLYFSCKEYDNSKRMCLLALTADGNHAEAMGNLSSIFHRIGMNHCDTDNKMCGYYLLKSLAINPSVHYYYNNYGGYLLRGSESEHALLFSARALYLKPDYAGAWFSRGVALADMVRPVEACESLRKAFTLDESQDRARNLYHYIMTVEPGYRLDESAPKEVLRGGTPIVFLHLNDSDYLQYSLGQAVASNPDCPVVLLGNDLNEHYPDVIHINIKSLKNENYGRFFNIYEHNSVNPFYYEIWCFLRWFILDEFVRRHELHGFMHLDSDVMLYGNVTEIGKIFSDYDFTLSAYTSPHCSYWRNVKALEVFCLYLLEMYSISDEKRRIMNRENYCDMDAFREFYEKGQFKIADSMKTLTNIVFDNNVSHSDGYETYQGIKKIYWRNDKPYLRQIDSGNEIPVYALHFQSGIKTGRTALMAKHLKLGANICSKT